MHPQKTPVLGKILYLSISIERNPTRSGRVSVKLSLKALPQFLLEKLHRRIEYKPLRSEIRAVVLSGDASSQGFDKLRKLMREEFTDLCDGPILDNLDPAYVLAYGAARLAKKCIVDMKNEGKMFGCGDATEWFREHGGEELW